MSSNSARAPYFVMAHHRSGSNFLNDVLQAHPRIECLNEPFSMHTRYFRECDLSCWSSEDFEPQLLHPSLAKHAALRSFLLDFRAYLSRSNSARVIGFKETALFGKLQWLREFMPSLKVLLLKRDPRSIVSSVLRSNLLDFWNYADLVPPAFEQICPAYTRGAQPDTATSAAEIVAMSVATRYELARRSIQLFDHRILHLEEFARRPERCLEDIASFLGVEPHDAQLSFLRERQATSRGGVFSSFRSQEAVEDGWKRHLSPEQVRVIESVLLAVQEEVAHASS